MYIWQILLVILFEKTNVRDIPSLIFEVPLIFIRSEGKIFDLMVSYVTLETHTFTDFLHTFNAAEILN